MSGRDAARIACWVAAACLGLLPVAVLIVESLAQPSSYLALADRRVLGLFLRTTGVALGGAIVAFALGGALAAVTETRRLPFRGALGCLAFVPLVVPPFVHVVAWNDLVSGDLFAVLGVGAGDRGAPPTTLRGSRLACSLLLGISYSPVAFYFASRALRSISGELVDAARIRLGPGAVWRRVLLPLAAPTLSVGVALTFVLAFLNFEIPDLLEVPTYPVEIMLQYGADEPGRAFALTMPALLLTLGVLWLAHSWATRRGFALGGRESHGAMPRRRVGAAGWCVLSFWWAMSVVLPIGVLVSMLDGVSILSRSFAESREHLLLGNLLPLGAALLCVAFAAALAGRPQRDWQLLLWAPFVVPGALLSFGVILVWNRPLLDAVFDSPLLLVAGGAARWMPIAYFALAAHLRSVPREYFESARLGCGGVRASLRRLRLVEGPLAMPGLALGALVIFLLASGELPMAVQLQHPGVAPVTVRIYGLLHSYRENEVAALILWHLAVVLAVTAGILGAARWLGRESRST